MTYQALSLPYGTVIVCYESVFQSKQEATWGPWVLFFHPFLYHLLYARAYNKPITSQFCDDFMSLCKTFTKGSFMHWIRNSFLLTYLSSTYTVNPSLPADVNEPKGKAEPGLTSCQLTQELIRYTFPICHFPRHPTLKKRHRKHFQEVTTEN